MSYLDKIENVYTQWNNASKYFDISTSGSTGKPKMIRIEKSKMIASAKMSLDFFKLKAGDPVLLALPADKIGGAMLIIRSIVGKLNLLHIEPKLNPFKNIELENNIKFCSLTPAQLASIYQNDKSTKQVRKIESILLGGAAVPSALLDIIYNEKGLFYHSYGMTETISHVAIKNLSGREPYFKALSGVSFSSTENDQLIIHADEILDDALLTNDIVKLIDSHTIIWKGRKDNVVNSGGIKLIIEEIEEKIRLDFDGEFYLTKEKDEILGEKLVMISKKKPPTFKHLNKYETPKRIHIVDKFKYTENGKLLRLSPQQLNND